MIYAYLWINQAHWVFPQYKIIAAFNCDYVHDYAY